MGKFKVAVMGLVAACMVGCTTTGGSGRPALTQGQINDVARLSGMFVGVSQVAKVKMSPEASTCVSNVLQSFVMTTVTSSNGVTAAKFADTYGQIMFAASASLTNIPARDLAMIQMSVRLSLLGVDTMVATHPEWKEQTDTFNSAVQNFIYGVQIGMMQQ